MYFHLCILIELFKGELLISSPWLSAYLLHKSEEKTFSSFSSLETAAPVPLRPVKPKELHTRASIPQKQCTAPRFREEQQCTAWQKLWLELKLTPKSLGVGKCQVRLVTANEAD